MGDFFFSRHLFRRCLLGRSFVYLRVFFPSVEPSVRFGLRFSLVFLLGFLLDLNLFLGLHSGFGGGVMRPLILLFWIYRVSAMCGEMASLLLLAVRYIYSVFCIC